jgi:exonuclease SbcD
MIRAAQFTDLHYGTKNLIEADRCFTYAVDRAIDLQVDVAVISGDATDHALDVHAPAFARLAANIRRLADHCPVLMLQGTYSHEPPGTLNIFRLLGGRHPIHVADWIGQVALTTANQWIASKDWQFDDLPSNMQALFSCIPTVNKAAVAATVGAAASAQAVGEHLDTLLRGFARNNAEARQRDLPTIGVSHGTVFGCLTEHGVPMAGFDHEFTTGSLFNAKAQAFMLGHIHRHQAWEQDGRWIAYPGSIGRFHYGEEGDKGFLLWEVGANTTKFTLEPTPAKRTIDLNFDGKPDLAKIREIVATQNIAGADVRVRWNVPDEDRNDVDRSAIENLLRAAADVKLEGRILPVTRTRAAGITHLGTLAEKINLWAKVTESNPIPLLACLDALQTKTPDQIAMSILQCEAEVTPEEAEVA